ncbi:MAG TPA: hypothetical protein VMN82_07235 [Thermoanaerobaculia bacterium]|nr:hypothetical protein [Thermoanaerobaculia bacterium]
MRAARAVLGLALAAAAASVPAAARVPGPPISRAPYDGPPTENVAVTVTLDLTAARDLLALLSAPQLDAERAKALEELPAVQAAIRESRRPAEVFEKDLVSAFDEKARPTVFDFHRIREESGRWKALLETIAAREADLTKMASDRARALLPGDRRMAVTETIYLTFGLPGRADHVAVPSANGAGWYVVIDLARALADVQGSAPADQVKHLARLMAGEAYQRAWAEYRAGSAAWQKRDASLGQLEPLLRRVAEAGPIALYSVDENFFPLAEWLRQPMRTNLDDLNRFADHLMAKGQDLDARMEVAAEIQKPEFTSNLAGPAGAFLSDAIVEGLGLDAYRSALAAGPRAFFEAYDRASQKKGSGLILLAKPIREQLAAPPPAAATPRKG